MYSATRKTHPFLQALHSQIILADGAMGTLLFERGTPTGSCLGELNLTDKDRVQEAHLDYILAGADLIQTNTFGTDRYTLKSHGLEKKLWDINVWGAKIARLSREIAGQPTWVAGSVGPLGRRIWPWGPLQPSEARQAITEQVEALLAGGVDLFILETMSHLEELLLTAEVVRSVCKLPIIASMTFSLEGRTLFGSTVGSVAKELFGLAHPPFDVLGVNCGAGPAPVLTFANEIASLRPRESSMRLAAQANAGLPKRSDGKYTYPSTPQYFADILPRFVDAGVSVIGGCCGTTPEHIRMMKQALTDRNVEQAAPGASSAPVSVTSPPVGGVATDTTGGATGSEQPADTATKARPLIVVKRAAQVPTESAAAQTEKSSDIPYTPWLHGTSLIDRLHRNNVISVELDPPRGSRVRKFVGDARTLRDAGVDTINVADSPMARVRMSAVAGSLLVAQATGISPIIHFTTRDRNLMGIQSDLLGAHALGIRNILALTGDAPGLGDYAHATAVYDVDSIGLIKILTQLNEGRDIGGNPIGKPTNFTIGAALDLNSETPEQLDHEVERFRQKLAAGAHFVMTQPVYEPEPYLDMLDRLGGLSVPVLLGVMPLHSLRHAEYLHNEVPGISVPAHIRQRLAEAGDDGQRVGLELAADVIRKTAPHVSGFYLVPSFGRFGGIATLVEELRDEWKESTSVSTKDAST